MSVIKRGQTDFGAGSGPGPANVVVPIYGMFIIGGSLLGVLFLGEPMTWNKIVGLAAAVIGVVLISI